MLDHWTRYYAAPDIIVWENYHLRGFSPDTYPNVVGNENRKHSCIGDAHDFLFSKFDKLGIEHID